VVTFGPGGDTTPEYLDRWAANTGRLEGASAEEAVPFSVAVRRSFVLCSLRSTILRGGSITHEMFGEDSIACSTLSAGAPATTSPHPNRSRHDFAHS
jgi:hypothetical protein